MFDDDEEDDFNAKPSIVSHKINEKTTDLNNKLNMILGENKPSHIESQVKPFEKKVENTKNEVDVPTSQKEQQKQIKKSIFIEDDEDVPFKKVEKVIKKEEPVKIMNDTLKQANEPLKIMNDPLKQANEPLKSNSNSSKQNNESIKTEKKISIVDPLSSKGKFSDPLSFGVFPTKPKTNPEKNKIPDAKEEPISLISPPLKKEENQKSLPFKSQDENKSSGFTEIKESSNDDKPKDELPIMDFKAV
jgi:hypothetical protein